MTMRDFSITDKAGTNLGTFTGRTPTDAMDALAHSNGYWDHRDQATMMGGQLARWTDKPSAFADLGAGLLVSLVASQPEEVVTDDGAGWPKTIEQIESESEAAHEAHEAAKVRLADATAEAERLGARASRAHALLLAAET